MKKSALGGDALDALLPMNPPMAKAAPLEVVRDEVAVDASASASVAEPKKRVGRPRGAGFGAGKGTRWKRSDGAEMRARSVHIPVELDQLLRRRAAEEDVPVGAVVIEALEKLLAEPFEGAGVALLCQPRRSGPEAGRTVCCASRTF